MRTPLYLEDLTVGQRFVTGQTLVDEAAIKAFARDFDPQIFHTDSEAAKDTFFAGLAASGWHTAAITMRLLVDSGPPLASDAGGLSGMIGAGGEIAWPRATRPGDILRVESEVLAVTPSRSRPERGLVTLRSETRNQKGEVVQKSAASPLGIVSSAQDNVPVPMPRAKIPNKAVCQSSRPRGRCAPMARATSSITPPEIV